MKNKILRSVMFCFCMIVPLGVLSGCAKESVNIIVLDGMTETRLLLEAGKTVGEALEEAEIKVNDKDRITPGKDETLTEDGSEITVSRYAKVTVLEGDKETELELTGQKVQDALDAVGMKLNKHDYINHSQEAYLSNGMEIDVVHRLAVTVSVDGEKKKCITEATDVEGLLEEQHISVGKKDRVSPALSKKLKEGSKVRVKRVSVKKIKKTEPIDFVTKTELSGSLYKDQTQEKTAGVKGKKEVVYKVTYVDGKEESRKAVKETVIQEPVAKVILKGTKERPSKQPGKSGSGGGKKVVSRQKVPDCDGSGHGYYIITYSDGSVKYQDY